MPEGSYRLTPIERARLPQAPGKPSPKRQESDPPASAGSAAVTVQVGRSRWTVPLAVISSMVTLAGSIVYSNARPAQQPTDATAQIAALDSKIGKYHDDTNEQIEGLRRAVTERIDAEHNRANDVAYQLREIDRRLARVERAP